LGGSTNSSGGANATGGASGTSVSTSTGGTNAGTGGATAGTNTATGGKATTGGAASTGGATGNPTTGGATAAGGSKATGGSKAVGGATATGGKAGGGNTGVGGNTTAATGGAKGETGGASTNGGATATGGSKSTGGSANGGATATGGSATTGGSTGVSEPICVTSTNNAWKTTTVAAATSSTADVTVSTTEGQTWEGFGGAFNELGWKYLTTAAMQEEAIRLLFSADGANFAWGRIPMGASDYAEIRYTLDDTADPNDPTPNSGETNRPPADTSMSKFSLTRDGKYLIPYIKAALGVKPGLRFWASPWTPPVWMKTGLKTNSGSDSSKPATRPSYFDGGNFVTNKPDYLTAYADYYKKFVEGYQAQGINIEVVSPQNEPGYDQNYPSCLWDKATYVSWVKALSTVMKPLNVKVMLGSMSNAGDGGRSDLDIADAVLADTTARAAVSVVGVQWGVLQKVVEGRTFSGLPIWASEHKCGNYPWESSYNKTQAPNDQAYGVESWGYIRDAITKGKVTAYNAWNMVLDKLGLGNDTTRDWKQDALLVADGGKVNTTQAYFVFRHFSQYVAPGAKVLGATGGDAVAFKNPDGSVVAVMYNSGAAKSTYAVKIGSKVLQFSMPAAGWATVVSPP
jgi:glucosylceramidase